ncbi:MAG: hypothetical protein V1723_02650 [Candidatus Uhrbacteria bacterium]
MRLTTALRVLLAAFVAFFIATAIVGWDIHRLPVPPVSVVTIRSDDLPKVTAISELLDSPLLRGLITIAPLPLPTRIGNPAPFAAPVPSGTTSGR